ncbi:MAG: VapE domain-containing protein [Pseudomonadota bacterium]
MTEHNNENAPSLENEGASSVHQTERSVRGETLASNGSEKKAQRRGNPDGLSEPCNKSDVAHDDDKGDTSPQADVNSAVKFLRKFRTDGPWVLTSIIPDGKTNTSTFRADQLDHMKRWIELEGAAKRNLYFTVNSTGDKNHTKKPSKQDIVAAGWLHVDVDPDGSDRQRLLQRLEGHNPPPNHIIDSGGGFQGFWRLSQSFPLSDHEEIEARNRHIETVLGGDHCHNADRIMRLPGTVNWPNKKKRAKGRVPAIARVVSFNDIEFDPSVFPLADEKATTRKSVAIVAATLSADEINDLPDSVRRVAVEMCNADGVVYDNRSDGVYYLCCEASRQGMSKEVTKALLLDPDLAVSAHVYDQANPDAYADRQIERGWKKDAEWPVTVRNGIPKPCYENVVHGLGQLSLDIWHNVFTGRDEIEGHTVQDYNGAVSDAAVVVLRKMFREAHGFDPGKEKLRDAIAELAQTNRRDPVVDHLDGLCWDGEPRVDGWLKHAVGCEDSPYTRAVGTLLLRAMCRRARQPGVKYDYMVILEGAQNLGKSTLASILAGREEWFTDAAIFSANSDKERGEVMQGKWVVESAELEGMTRRDVAEVKRFVTVRVDSYRMAYAVYAIDRPRRCVLIGTTNETNWNKDPTGARRFLPVWCEKVDLVWLRANRDQLLAEADTMGDGPLVLPDEVLADATAQQTARLEGHSYDEFLVDMVPEEQWGAFERVSSEFLVDEVLKLGRNTLANPHTMKTITQRMTMLGWEKGKVRFRKHGKVMSGFKRPTDSPDRPEIPF